jgi:hypothetical protein
MSKNLTMTTAGGRIRCTQCQALAKSTQLQCRRPATSGKRVCKLHGGNSTGPKTPEGRQRCAEARLVHGQETARNRKDRSLASARLAVLEWAGHSLQIMHGPRTRGPKPNRMDEVELELQQAVCQILLRTYAENYP